MRIALLAPLVSPIAPPFLGGAQALLADLAAGLARRGHTVTLYAADGSSVPGVEVPKLGIDSQLLTPAQLTQPALAASKNMPPDHATAASRDNAEESEEEEEEEEDVWPGGLGLQGRELYLSDYAFLRAYRAIGEQAKEYDLVHAHAYDAPAFAYSAVAPLPILHTLHLPLQDESIRAILAMIAPRESAPSTRLVTVSEACAATYLPFCRIDQVIYNGIQIERIPFRDAPATPSYLLYAGRISPEKGVEDAVEIARRAGERLIIAGGIYDHEYFAERLEPQLRARPDDVTYVGQLSREQIWSLMGGARALLVPSYWDEPFGLVAAEAQAAGTPVIAYARGGLREVVSDGITGSLVDPGDIDSASSAVAEAGRYDRAGCRSWVAGRFSLDTMLDAYLQFYHSMLGY